MYEGRHRRRRRLLLLLRRQLSSVTSVKYHQRPRRRVGFESSRPLVKTCHIPLEDVSRSVASDLDLFHALF